MKTPTNATRPGTVVLAHSLGTPLRELATGDDPAAETNQRNRLPPMVMSTG